MSFKTILFAGVLALSTAGAAFASGIELHDAYARASNPTAKTGAAFMVIHNHGGPDDRLIGVSSPVAERVELHTHQEDDNGVVKMRHVEEGFDLPADGELVFERGGNHVMFMGLKEPFEQGKMVPLTLIFKKAGDVETQVEVDLERTPDGSHDHSD